jgi:hypothetical protein
VNLALGSVAHQRALGRLAPGPALRAAGCIPSCNLQLRSARGALSRARMIEQYAPELGRSWLKGGIETCAESAAVSERRLTYAYLIEQYAPELGDQVLAKQITFEEARLKARARRALGALAPWPWPSGPRRSKRPASGPLGAGPRPLWRRTRSPPPRLRPQARPPAQLALSPCLRPSP